MITVAKVQAALAIALLVSSVRAFEPTFSTPRQCESLSLSWSSMELPTSVALTEITVSLIPLDSNPAYFPPDPYTFAVPCSGAAASAGSVSIPTLPFPAGTDFFAQAYIPGLAGPVKRTVSNVMKVEHSADSSCLPTAPGFDKRRVKQFGKRQISVIGANTVAGSDLTASAAAPTSSSGAPINVIGVGQVPADASSDPAATTTSSSSATASSGAPPINVIGTSQVSATPEAGNDSPPVNAVPSPSSSGPTPAVVVIGTSFVDATAAPDAGSDSSSVPTATDSTGATSTEAAFVPDFTTVDSGSQQDETTSCTSTWSTETAAAEETSTDCTTTWTTETAEATSTDCTSTWTTSEATATEAATQDSNYNYNNYNNYGYDSSSASEEAETSQPCTDSVDSTQGTEAAAPTHNYYDESSASTYGSFDDMVNHANEVFHAWNPYKPAYTPST